MPASAPSLQNSLLGIDVWDGTQHIGSRDVSWQLSGPDATFSAVAPSASSAHSGLTVIPGLIDTHVHLVGDASGGPSDFLTWPLTTRPEEQVLHGLAHAKRALTGGVTTLRDLSCDDIQFSLARGLASGVVEGPRVLAYGLVTMTGGHGDLFVPPAVPQQLRKRTADGPDDCRQLVRHWARSGADGIKITTSGGVLSDGDKNSWRNYTAAELDAIVDEAHALGLRVAAHAHTPEGVEAALDAGVDSIEHATNITEELAERVVAAGLPVAPTLLINDSLADGSAPASAAQQEKVRELVRIRDARLRYAADAGVNFVLGTDANGFHIDFGDQFAELRRMVEILGYSPERALQAGTSAAAEVIGAGDSLGRIREGAHADFLLMRGTPWQNTEDLSVENIVAVVSKGRVVFGALPTA